MKNGVLASTSLALVLAAGTAVAQQQVTTQQPAAQSTPVAEQCLQDLRAFDEEARREGYGLIGPGPAGVRAGRTTATGAATPAAGTAPATGVVGTPATTQAHGADTA